MNLNEVISIYEEIKAIHSLANDLLGMLDSSQLVPCEFAEVIKAKRDELLDKHYKTLRKAGIEV